MKTAVKTIVLILAVSTGVSGQTSPGLSDGRMLDDFEYQTKEMLPYGWYDRDGNKPLHEHDPEEQETYKYRVLESKDGNMFLRYEGTRAKHMNYPLANKEEINIYETPILSWKVRPYNWPQNANEDNDDHNDSVASIYVVFDMGHVLFRKVPKSIRYTWSTTLEEGTELSKFFGNQKIVVVESGEKKKGRWMTFQRNIVEDYRRLFGDDPPEHPLAILILSDGDSTGSFVKADYDDIMLLPKN